MTLMFTRDHRVMGKVELVQSFCHKVKLQEAIQMCVMVDDIMGTTVKPSNLSKYGEYGSFEHLFFMS